MKRFLSLLLMCLMVLSFVPVVQAETDITELTFYYPVTVSGALQQLMDQICQDFNVLNPDIKINMVYTGTYDDNIVKLQTAIQGNTAPDFWVSLYNHKYTFKALNAIASMNDLVAKDGGNDYLNDFIPTFLADSYLDGELISIPFMRSSQLLYYNKDAFKEVGLDPERSPVTWDELVEYAQKLVIKDGNGNVSRYGIGYSENFGNLQFPFTANSVQNSADGSNMFSPDGAQVFIDTPENIEVLQFWMDVKQKYGISPEGIVQFKDLPTLFFDNQLAIMYNTSGNMRHVLDNAPFEVGIAAMPYTKRPATVTGGGNFYISNSISPERQEKVWRFIRYATSPEVQAQWFVDTGYVAARKSSFDTDVLKTYIEQYPAVQVAREQVEFAFPELSSYECAKIWRILSDNVQAALIGDKTAAEALADAQVESNETLEKYQ